MTCDEFLTHYSDYLDECFGPADAARWSTHIGECASCARYDRVMRRGLTLVRDLPPVVPGEDFTPRLQHRLYHVQDELIGGRQRGMGRVTLFAGAAVLVIAVAWSPLARPDLFQGEAATDSPAAVAPAPVAPPAAAPAARADSHSLFVSAVSAPTPEYWQTSGTHPGEISGVHPVRMSAEHLPGPYSPVFVGLPSYRAGDVTGSTVNFLE